ncbi:MAG: helix-turn-helix domain-containing protein [Bacteroidales bacterium]
MKISIRYPLVILIGFFFGIFVFLPINEFTSYFEYKRNIDLSVWQFMKMQQWEALTLATPVKFFFYLFFGGFMGIVSVLLMRVFRRRNILIDQLQRELDKNLSTMISKGESDEIEFKSSFRYDYRLQKVNKGLETVILKTIAGFMNTQGGTLLIGVADDGSIVGVEADYNSLSRKDSDGYTQLLMSSIAEKIGTPACKLVKILFQMQDEKEVCRVIVLPSPIPVYVKDDNQHRFFVRTGSGTREMDIREAITFIKLKWG